MSTLRIAAFHGNCAHAPASSVAAVTSAYTSGAWLVGLEVRASRGGELFVIHRADSRPWRSDGLPIADVAASEVRGFDLGSGLRVEGGTEEPWARPTRPALRIQSLGGMLDAIPEALELLLTVPPDVRTRAEVRRRVVELVRGRGVESRVWLEVDAGEPAQAWAEGLRTAVRLQGAALTAWLAAPGSHAMAIAPLAALIEGPRGARRRRLERPVHTGTLVAELDAALDEADLREVASLLDGTVDALAFRSSLRLADVLSRWRMLERASFAGEEEEPSRIRFGYARVNRFAHVFQRDGVHVEIQPYRGRTKLSKLEERVNYAVKDSPFYSGGGLGTAFPIDADFSAEVDFEWAAAKQATMLEMAVVNVEPPAHRPGWRDVDGKREPNLPELFRDKNNFFDPHGAPPFVGVERDEDDGFRVNWNTGTDYDNNHYGRPFGNGDSKRGRLRLDRRGCWFTAYYRDGGNPDWVCVGSCRNDSMNRRVFLRCAAKRWRQERPDGGGFMPIPENHVTFRDLTLRTLLPAAQRPR